MQLNLKKMSIYFIFLILGMSMISFGLMNIAYDLQNEEMSDQEIIQRAKALGMVELKDQLNEKSE
ncbi:MAG TPA: hypothetical protein VJ962_04605 [Clostridia bacterium]|nr:hypothetical protein [Clostridia bacterium]